MLLCLLLLAAGCGGPAGAGPAGITSFEPPSGVLQGGEPASASVRVANRGTDADSMQPMVNAWYPDWLPGEEPEKDGLVQVDWIQR